MHGLDDLNMGRARDARRGGHLVSLLKVTYAVMSVGYGIPGPVEYRKQTDCLNRSFDVSTVVSMAQRIPRLATKF